MQIESLIPHRAPFIMVDTLVHVTHEKFETEFRIEASNVFLENGVLREFALIENIAQSAAAGIALLGKSGQEKPAEGFLGGISKLILYELPRINDTVYTIVTPIAQMGNMYLMKGETYVEGRKLLECELKLVGA